MFHQMDGLSVQEARAANVRVFVGDGTPYLKVPGLQAVKSVRVGQCVIPPTITQKFPKDASHSDFEVVESPMYIIQTQADGMPVLLRNIQSNDGVWQNGVSIFVQGAWEGDAPEEAASESAAELTEEEKAAADAAAAQGPAKK